VKISTIIINKQTKADEEIRQREGEIHQSIMNWVTTVNAARKDEETWKTQMG